MCTACLHPGVALVWTGMCRTSFSLPIRVDLPRTSPPPHTRRPTPKTPPPLRLAPTQNASGIVQASCERGYTCLWRGAFAPSAVCNPPPPPKMGHGTTHFSGAVEEAAAQLGLHLIHVFFASLLYNTVSYIPSSSHPSTATAAAVPPLNLFPILSSSTLSPLLRASHGGKRYS